MVSNFSASPAKLESFLEACQGRLRVFSCSLHLEYARPDEFLERCQWFQNLLKPPASLCVTCVATRDNLPRLAELRRQFEQGGVRFKVQPEKQNRDLVQYTPEEKGLLRGLGGHNLLGELAFDFFGRPCWAGSRYFILDDQGQAFRCYPARRYKIERMGNFLSPDFQLAEGPQPCQYHYCNCTVPIERHMMPR